ncbi:hypothetical protein Misp01_54940 [Microtetraspora sp. NBRC 13810]|uniref:hypothetical protein n=1 Tax=Microtetraspora sp. NBRC 13810 TaxID=3030990 RepID=UPI00249FAE7C|nr:hypothetical protein [Microtetraspora sp. NBRC 13810]GLW10366.1 hypothetical protein Misp01_54940 [Microtetraspora sp. NBRC 13810]
MNRKKLASVLLGSATAAALLLTPETAASAQAGAASSNAATAAAKAAPAKAATASARAAVERDSVKCSKPGGKWANYSWGEGNTTVTIYFNNHCSHKVSTKIAFERKGSVGDKVTKYRCMTVNARTKGKKKFYAAAYKPYSVIRVARCS